MWRLFSFRTRNWRSFNLRALLLGVTLAAIGCGVVAQYYMPFQRQHAAIADLKGRYKFISTRSGGPEWLHKLFGEDHFQNVTALHPSGMPQAGRSHHQPRWQSEWREATLMS